MDYFINETTDGNEKAIKKGRRVPNDAVNLAWVTSPKLNPEDNLSIIDTSSMYSENRIDELNEHKIMYANSIGVLEDWNGNQLIDDEMPAITDVFSIDEDYSTVEGSEYKPEHILSFVHKSRHYHIDHAALTLGTELQTYETQTIKIIDSKGRDYVNENGDKRYRIQITPVPILIDGNEREALYRVYAFVDTASNEDLYLKYNCVELDANNEILNQRSDYIEILNPKPYFKQIPEPAEVVDPVNRKKKQFATQSAGKKEQAIGYNKFEKDGYKAYVPKKAIGDTRLFQLFRWRVGCTFTDEYRVDPGREPGVIKAGIIVTTKKPNAESPYVFYNLMNSSYNPGNIKFVNPLSERSRQAIRNQNKTRDYWQVNIDTLSDAEMAEFDILIWSPDAYEFKMGGTPAGSNRSYLSKILHFTGNLGGTIIFDTNNKCRILDLGVTPSSPIDPWTAIPITKPIDNDLWKYVDGKTMRFADEDNILAQGRTRLGGWDLFDGQGDAEQWTISPYKFVNPDLQRGIGRGYVQRIISKKSNWITVLEGEDEADDYRPVVIRSKANSGNLVYSTIGMTNNVNYIYNTGGKRVSKNSGATCYSANDYQTNISSHFVEGAYKFLFNTCLLAVYGKHLDSSDERNFSTTWTEYSPWQASWVINNAEGVLSKKELAESEMKPDVESASVATPEIVWKRQLSSSTLKAIIDGSLNPSTINRVKGLTRSYFIEVTNPDVLTLDPSTLTDQSIPQAWTKAPTPPFTVPADLGPHVIKQDNLLGDYSDGSWIEKSYPAKGYDFQVYAQTLITEQHIEPKTATFTVTANVTKIKTVGASSTESILDWTDSEGYGGYYDAGRPHEEGLDVPMGIVTWQDGNYYSSAWGPGNLNWPHWGMNQRLSRGSTGEVVGFLHHALNQIHPDTNFDPKDSTFGSKTEAVVTAFQEANGARFVDGIVDAETWFLIGNQIIAHVDVDAQNQYKEYYTKPRNYILKQNLSDNSELTSFLKRSSTVNSPSIIWEMFKIQFDDTYNIHGIELTPHLTGQTKSLMFRSVDVRNSPVQMEDYDSRSGKLTYMPFRPTSGSKFFLPVGPYSGDTVIIGLGQDNPSGWGSSREIGIKNIRVYAQGSKGNGRIEVTEEVESVTASVTIPKTGPQTVQLAFTPPKGEIWKVDWLGDDFEISDISNADIHFINVTSTGIATFISYALENPGEDGIVEGPRFSEYIAPKLVRSMNEDGALNPGIENGLISKSDGVKLICRASKTPLMFPTLDQGIGPFEQQYHFSSLKIKRYSTDHSITIGFYDKAQKEFILNKKGEPEISYLEYLKRGPHNVYVGVVSNYSEEVKKPLPEVLNGPKVPYRWAMPVYGVTFRKGSAIQIERPSKSLNYANIWSLPIRTGSFSRSVIMPSKKEQIINGFYQPYQGATLHAHYEIAESDNVPWSIKHGRPYRDIVNEHPIVLDEKTLQVREAPILLVDKPTPTPGLGDPARPEFKLYKRATMADPWTEVTLSEIKDYNVSNGIIILEDALPIPDENLVKVTYTTSRPVFHYKGTRAEPLVLNPYLSESEELLNRPIYIGILPKYVTKDGVVVPGSTTDETLFWTTDLSDISDPISSNYNPFFLQLGIVYISPTSQIENLKILDTRSRGGGARPEELLSELIKSIEESKYYWDIGNDQGMSYQVGGFVIIRLPSELKTYFKKSEIIDIIEKNITSGVQFKIEDLDGQDWDDEE